VKEDDNTLIKVTQEAERKENEKSRQKKRRKNE
jgi:hypothetical protein